MILSQRRADALRDVLANTFKISSKRLQSLGVGEEQFIDQARPDLAGQSADPDHDHRQGAGDPAATPAAPAAAKKGAKKKK